jgi:hypothetical protein
VARILIVGGGCRGRSLARELLAEGHAVRITSRLGSHRGEIEAIGAEAWAGTPDAVGSLRYALENVTLVLWALGTASGGDAQAVAALHGSRLHMMLRNTIDTTVRGVIYEANGTLDPSVLEAGAQLVATETGRSEIPWAVLRADPADPAAWLVEARAAVTRLLSQPSPSEVR